MMMSSLMQFNHRSRLYVSMLILNREVEAEAAAKFHARLARVYFHWLSEICLFDSNSAVFTPLLN